jgi:hypothetical protein
MHMKFNKYLRMRVLHVVSWVPIKDLILSPAPIFRGLEKNFSDEDSSICYPCQRAHPVVNRSNLHQTNHEVHE